MGVREDEINEVHTGWIAAVNTGDLHRLLTLMTDDVVFLNPGQSPFGRVGFAANFQSSHQRVLINCVSELEEIVLAGDVAYTRSKDALSVKPRAGGDVVELAGYRMSVYRRQPNGSWLLARDAHTLSKVEN